MNLTDEIMSALNEFADVEYDTLQEAINKVAKETVQELKATSPRQDGDYAKGWAVKKQKDGYRKYSATVHNKKEYRLTHLLEYGHVKVLWGRRTNGFVEGRPRIQKAEKNAIERLETELKAKL